MLGGMLFTNTAAGSNNKMCTEYQRQAAQTIVCGNVVSNDKTVDFKKYLVM